MNTTQTPKIGDGLTSKVPKQVQFIDDAEYVFGYRVDLYGELNWEMNYSYTQNYKPYLTI